MENQRVRTERSGDCERKIILRLEARVDSALKLGSHHFSLSGSQRTLLRSTRPLLNHMPCLVRQVCLLPHGEMDVSPLGKAVRSKLICFRASGVGLNTVHTGTGQAALIVRHDYPLYV